MPRVASSGDAARRRPRRRPRPRARRRRGAYARLLGRTPRWRGEHPGNGTANQLFRLANTYVELLATGAGAFADALLRQLDSDGEGVFALAFATHDAGAFRAPARAGHRRRRAGRRGLGRECSRARCGSGSPSRSRSRRRAACRSSRSSTARRPISFPRSPPLGKPDAAPHALDHVVLAHARAGRVPAPLRRRARHPPRARPELRGLRLPRVCSSASAARRSRSPGRSRPGPIRGIDSLLGPGVAGRATSPAAARASRRAPASTSPPRGPAASRGPPCAPCGAGRAACRRSSSARPPTAECYPRFLSRASEGRTDECSAGDRPGVPRRPRGRDPRGSRRSATPSSSRTTTRSRRSRISPTSSATRSQLAQAAQKVDARRDRLLRRPLHGRDREDPEPRPHRRRARPRRPAARSPTAARADAFAKFLDAAPRRTRCSPTSTARPR